VLNGIFFVLRTGCQWKALDKTGICKGSTAHSRFQEWLEDGFFARLWEASLQDYDAMKGLDWSWLALDGAMTKAPLGGEKMWPQSYRPRQRRRETKPANRSRGHSGGPGD
jgi:transposase